MHTYTCIDSASPQSTVHPHLKEDCFTTEYVPSCAGHKVCLLLSRFKVGTTSSADRSWPDGREGPRRSERGSLSIITQMILEKVKEDKGRQSGEFQRLDSDQALAPRYPDPIAKLTGLPRG